MRDLRRAGVEAPLIFLTYYNPILAMGLQRFAGLGAEAGLDGVIVPDLPPEESDELVGALEPAGIDPIFLVAPTSTEERLRAVAARARGFVYCVSLTGVTGARSELSTTLPGVPGPRATGHGRPPGGGLRGLSSGARRRLAGARRCRRSSPARRSI